jgi:hypothetical protein
MSSVTRICPSHGRRPDADRRRAHRPRHLGREVRSHALDHDRERAGLVGSRRLGEHAVALGLGAALGREAAVHVHDPC